MGKATKKARREGRVRNARQARKIVNENRDHFWWDDQCTKHRGKVVRTMDNRKFTTSGHSENDEYGVGLGRAFWKFFAVAIGVLIFLMFVSPHILIALFGQGV